MKETTTAITRMLIAILLLASFSFSAFAQKVTGEKKVTDYTSIAKVNSHTDGVNVTYTNPYTNATQSTFAGAFDGTLNSTSKKFYCIDLKNNLATNEDYWDEGITPSKVTYVLNNYYPYKTGYAGAMTEMKKEASAVQLAIWHFMDNLNANTVTDAAIKTRALAIIADANTNHANVTPIQTLVILPASMQYIQGTNAVFNVLALDLSGNPIAGKTINISTTGGTLSATSGVTDANGKVGPITLTYSGTGAVTVSAKATIEIPQGTIYVHKTNSSGKQKLVLATPVTDLKKVDAKFSWFAPAGCDLSRYMTFTQGGWGSPSNSQPGSIRDANFAAVYPNGLTIGGNYTIKLTSATAVKNYLPDGGTASALTQNYINPTAQINVLAGQITALKLNVDYSAAGYLGAASVSLGSLNITSGPFTGMTVNQFLAIANSALGGASTTYSLSAINDAATAINENFNDGANKEFLGCDAPKASIGDRVWIDTNKNGIQDNGEVGLANVTVKLYTCANVEVATTTTNASGIYSFTNLTPGDYYLVFTTPSGYTVTTKDAGSNDALDSDVDAATGKTICTTLSPGENDLTWDAGFYTECKNKIGDFVWHDKNLNGIQDSGEPGISGVKIELLSGSTVVASSTTNASGAYSFSNLANGTYGVRVAASNYNSGGALLSTTQTKWYATKKNQGTNDEKDNDANKNEIVTVTVNCGDDLTVDFGFYKTCVSVSKTANKQTAAVGDIITYTITVENCGDVKLAGGVDLVDAMLGINMNFSLEAGASKVVTGTYTVKSSDCGNLVNTVSATGHPVNHNETVKDSASFTVLVDCDKKADLKIEKTSNVTNANCGDNVTYTIKVTNLGPDAASNVVVNDALPASLLYQSASVTQGSFNSTSGLWNVGTLANGANATLTLNVKIDCSTANSTPFDLGAAKTFNLFILEDLNQPSSDTEGKVAVGRNATLANYSVGDRLPSNSGDVLIVGNHLQYTSGQVFHGNVVYGNTTNLPLNSVSISGGTLRKDNPIDFAAAKTYLQGLSTSLGSYTVNGSTTFQWGTLTLTGNDPYLNVFHVNESDLSSANSVIINAPNGSVVLVNINGTTVSWMGGLVVNGTAITNVLYNFYQAQNLNISGIDVRGSILAPYAALNYPAGVIHGQVIVKSMIGSGQFNLALFGGNIPVDKKITNVAIASSTTTDPQLGNNTASATVNIGSTNGSGTGPGTGTGSGTGTGTGSNGGGSWSAVCSFAQGQIIYTLLYDGGSIYAGTMGGMIYKTTNGGQNWTLINSGMGVGFIWAFTNNNGTIFAATENGVYKYTGTAWVLTSLSGKDVHTLAAYNGTLYAGTWGFGIFKSTDNGTTWSAINTGLEQFLTVQAITVHNGTIFAGTIGGGMFKSTDGATWSKTICGYQAIWALGSNGSAIFAGTYGDGIYKSVDGGLSFTKLSSLPVAFIYSIVTDASGKVYASSLTNGVFVSADNGATWSALGMSGYGVSALMVNPKTSDVYAGTKEGVIYKISGEKNTTSVEGSGEMPTEFKLAQNYPNPFNPTTTIEFAVTKAGNYALKVYDVLGQEIASLIDQNLNAGTHKVNFDASKLSSGMYIYRLTGSNVNLTKKMLLTK